jgi:hypothetical protein
MSIPTEDEVKALMDEWLDDLGAAGTDAKYKDWLTALLVLKGSTT